MKFNRFILYLFIRVILIAIILVLFAFFLQEDERIFTSILFGLLAALQTYLLFRYVSRTNRDLANFMVLIKEGDLSNQYPEKIENNFKGLKDTFQKINDEFKEINKRKEQRLNYLEVIIDNNKTGILSYNKDGRIDIANGEAIKLLSVKSIHNISELDSLKTGFSQFVKELNPGEVKSYKILIDDSLKVFLFQSTLVKMDSESFSIISFQDIKSELDIKELDSFKKMVRVIVHEIMNSLTPITTLTKTIRNNLEEIESESGEIISSKENMGDIKESIDLIDDRAISLSKFVEKYRSLSQLPAPQIATINVKQLFKNIELLFSDSFKKSNIKFSIELSDSDLMIEADEGMIKQVLINLVKNAIDAVQNIKFPKIILSATQNVKSRLDICITDNGKGIEEEEQEKVFQPFYTNKKLGSGIGLSISRQIVHLHQGKISLKSKVGEGSTFCFNI